MVDIMRRLPALGRIVENIMNQQVSPGQNMPGPRVVIRKSRGKSVAAVNKDHA